jgi:hypothetical protein
MTLVNSILTTTSRRAVPHLRGASNRVVLNRGVAAAASPRRCPSLMCHNINTNNKQYHPQPSSQQVACFSSKSGESESKSGGVRGWMEGRQERQEKEKYLEQMERLSDMDELTLANYRKMLEEGLNSWGAKLTFGLSKEVKTAKEVVSVVACFMDVLGADAKADDLIHMDRLQKLQVATASNKTLEETAIMMSQIQNMDLMQRTLKKRRMEGKPIPQDANSMQAAIKKDAVSVMSKSQKEMMKNRQADQARRMARKRSR